MQLAIHQQQFCLDAIILYVGQELQGFVILVLKSDLEVWIL